jgi:hypothetical protein
MEYRDRDFTNESVVVDGNTYTGCTFRDCTLIYRGGELPRMLTNTIAGMLMLKFEDAAERTIQMLGATYSGMGPIGRQIVDAAIANIRRGPKGG